jgi:CubicO group peptidase (beta-lactamase class C family)
MNPKTGMYPYRYSDLGYYFLKRMIEKYSNQQLEDFLAENLYKPMGMSHTLYKPLEKYSKEEITPTERDAYFRDTLIWGTVHDQGASLMDGVGGHAGLFSTADDLAKLGQLMLQKGQYGTHQYLSDKTVTEFTRKQFDGNRRALAWDMIRMVGNGGTSDLASPQCYGHSGFTGTGIWIDPTYDLVYIFLSNRVYPSASNKKLYEWDIRTRIHDAIYHSIMNFNTDELVFY